MQLEGVELPVDALIKIGVDPSTITAVQTASQKLGKAVGDNIAKGAKSSGDVFKDIDKALAGASSRAARDKAFQNYFQAILRLAREAQQAVNSVGDTAARSGARAAAGTQQAVDAVANMVAQVGLVSSAQRQAATVADAANDKVVAGTEEIVNSLRLVFKETKNNEQAFSSLAQVIASSINKAAREISKDIVAEQSFQQQEGIIKQRARLAAQQAKDANRIALQQQRANDRELEQARQAAARESLATQRSQLAQSNSAFNASLQTQLVEEKGFQQRRTAIVQSGLLATRSLYQSLGSGASSVVRGAYSLIQSATKSGEDQTTALNRQGLLERKAQTERIMQQTVASVRKEQGSIAAAATQLDKGGVLGAVTGQSRTGALLRGGALGAGAIGGALGIKQLTTAASDFEANLRIFAVLNDELQQTPALMDDVRQTALDLGRDIALPGVSAGDAAAAITALAKTGLDLDDSMGAAKGSLLLARQAGVDFAESARTIGSTLNALRLQGTDATAVVDGFTAAMKLSGGATFDELRQAQQQSLLVFRQAFKGAEEPLDIMNNLNASLALFSRNALRGSDAGTSLKTFISSLSGISAKSRGQIEGLVKSTDKLQGVGPDGQGFGGGNFLFRENGQARKFAETIDLIKVSFGQLSPKDRAVEMREIFGSDAIRAAEIFFSSSEDEIANLVGELQRSTGITEKLAKAKNQGLRAAADAFVSTIETIYIVSFKKLDIFFGNVINGISKAIDALFFSPALKGLRGALIGIGAALASIIAAKAAVEVFQLLKIAVAALATPLGLVTLALSAVGGAIGFVLAQSEPLREALGRVFDSLKGGASDAAKGPLQEIGAFFDKIRKQVERAAEVVGFFITLLIDDDIRQRFIEWQKLDPSAEKEGIFGWFLNIRKEIPNLISTVVETFQKVVSFIGKVATDPAFETFRKTIVGVAAGVTAVIVGIAAISKARAGLAALQTAATVVASLASPLGFAVVGLGLLGGALFALYSESEPFRNLVAGLVDLIKELVGSVVRAAMPAIKKFAGIIRDAGTKALEVFLGAFETVVEYLGSAGFVGVLESVGEVVGKVIEGIASAFSQVVTFITALARTISDLGIFEGLRQGAVVVFEGLADLVGGVLSGIGKTIQGFFGGLDWGQIAAAAAAGIFRFFQSIGRAVGTFLGSKEFLATVVTALGILAGALASAATGLVSGFIEGLYKSDAGDQIVEFFKELVGLGTDELGGAGDAIAGALRQATLDGLTLALSIAFPPELFRRLLTDPLGSALGAAVVVVEALFVGKIVGLFISGFTKIKVAAAGVQLIGTVLSGGLGAANAQLDKTKKKADESAATLQRISGQYGGFAATVAKAADGVKKFGDRGKETADVAQTFAKNVDGQTAALLRNEGSAKANVGGLRDVRREMAESVTQTSKTSEAFAGLSDKYVSMVATIAGGAAGGAGLGQALTADNPLGVISGITAAIGGIGTVAVTTASVVATSGLTAGLLTGGVGIAVTAITTGVTLLLRKQNEAKAIAEATAQEAENLRSRYEGLFKGIIDATSGSQTLGPLEFLAQLKEDGTEGFEELTTAAETWGISMGEVTAAIAGSDEAFNRLVVGGAKEISQIEEDLKSLREEQQRQLELAVDRGDTSYSNSDAAVALREEIAAGEARIEALLDAATNAGLLREQYIDMKEQSSAELAIRREIKDLEKERETSVEAVLGFYRDAETSLNNQATALLTIADLEAGRSGVSRAEIAAREGLRGIVDDFKPDSEGNIAASFTAPAGSAQNDAALRITESLRSQIGIIAADTANNVSTQEEYNAAIQQTAAEYQKVLETAGASPEVANQIIQGIFNGFTDGKQVINSFLIETEDGIKALQASLEAPWVAEVVASLDPGPARDALERFIEAPDAKNIEALFNLGVPKEVLAAFIADPSEKTIQPILNALTGADQAELANITAPVPKPIVLTLDRASVQRVTQQIARGVGGVPYSIGYLEAAQGVDLNGNGIIGSKYGRIITEPTLSWLGEEKRKEVVIPLTMPNRAAQLYEQSGMASVLARAGVVAPGAVQQAATVSSGPSRNEFDRMVGELQALRSDLREDMDTRRDNVFLMESVEDPYPTARQTASKLRQRRRRRR